MLDAFHHGQVESHMSVTKIMADSEYLRECQDLFELYVSDYIMLTRCKVSLRLFVTAEPAIASWSTLFWLGLESANVCCRLHQPVHNAFLLMQITRLLLCATLTLAVSVPNKFVCLHAY